MKLFENKTVLVTGSSRGIGRAIALAFAARGADVAVHHRKSGGSSEAGARDVCAAVEALGCRSCVVRGDIAVRDEVDAFVGAAAQQLGRLDVLVLNAARAPFKPLERLLERDLRLLVDTNFIGNILCLRAALPHLEKTGGSVVFISSLGSRFHMPSYALGSMKAAMEAATRDCAMSLAPRGVRVNAVCGGLVKTDSYKTLRLTWDNADRVPDEACVEPEEIADVVLFLCSPAARAIRGQTIVVDRGLGSSLG